MCARLGGKVVAVEGLTDVLADERKNNENLPAGVITRLYPDVCLERGSSGVVTLQTW